MSASMSVNSNLLFGFRSVPVNILIVRNNVEGDEGEFKFMHVGLKELGLERDGNIREEFKVIVLRFS